MTQSGPVLPHEKDKMNFKTSAQVAEILGMSWQSLNMFLNNHPELRPVKRLAPSGDLWWTDEEIDWIIEFSTNKRKGDGPQNGVRAWSDL